MKHIIFLILFLCNPVLCMYSMDEGQNRVTLKEVQDFFRGKTISVIGINNKKLGSILEVFATNLAPKLRQEIYSQQENASVPPTAILFSSRLSFESLHANRLEVDIQEVLSAEDIDFLSQESRQKSYLDELQTLKLQLQQKDNEIRDLLQKNNEFQQKKAEQKSSKGQLHKKKQKAFNESSWYTSPANVIPLTALLAFGAGCYFNQSFDVKNMLPFNPSVVSQHLFSAITSKLVSP